MNTRYALSLTFLLCIFQSLAQGGDIQSRLESKMQDSRLRHASVSMLVYDLQADSVLADVDAERSLSPASCMKLFSTSAALRTLGKDHRIPTEVLTSGKMNGQGVIEGDLIIKGYGDPTWGSRYIEPKGVSRFNFLSLWADSLWDLGVRQVTGNVIGDGSAFGYMSMPDGWNWSDIGNYYGAHPSALAIYDNTVYVTFKTAHVDSISTITKILPDVPGLRYENLVLSSQTKGDQTYLYGAPLSCERYAVGTLPAHRTAYEVRGSIPDPEWVFAAELKKALERKGIKVGGSAYTHRNYKLPRAKDTLIRFLSPPLFDIIDQINTRSINIYAENVAGHLAYMQTGNGSSESTQVVLGDYWNQRIDPSGLYIKDGSGLSRTNTASASHFVQMLKNNRQSPEFEAFKQTLAIAGEKGTLAGIGRGSHAQGKIWAKSGTMSKVKSYSGYAITRSGREIAFSLIVNNFEGSNVAVKQFLASIMLEMTR